MHQTQVILHDTLIEIVPSYKYLDVFVDTCLSWSAHIEDLCCEVQQPYHENVLSEQWR